MKRSKAVVIAIISHLVGVGANADEFKAPVPSKPPSSTAVNSLAAPTSLAANATPNSVSLSWVDAANNEAGFEIERMQIGNATRKFLVPANSVTFVDQKLSVNTDYRYRLRAYALNGSTKVYSPYSSLVPVKTGAVAPLLPPPAAPSLSFSSNQSSIQVGESATLSWASANATACAASGSAQFSGNVALSQSALSVSPTETTKFSLTCSGQGGSVTKAVDLVVNSLPPPAPAPPLSPTGKLKAFPTAEGFGANSEGGRGGAVYIVSTLADSGAGSLRECVSAVGSRTCVFAVSGTIELDSALAIRNPNITIAGQTSPGGIQLKNRNNLQSPILVDANHVIIRHLRIRPGPSPKTSDLVDAVTIGSRDKGVQHVILDHVSLSWATDEIVQTGTSQDVTIQWSYIYENLSHSTHYVGEHSKGPFFRGNRATMYMNYVANNTRRMPNIASFHSSHQIDIVNNIFYNVREAFGEVYDEHGKANVNYVGNIAQMGPMSQRNLFALYPAFDYANSGGFGFALYVKDNLDPNRQGLAGEADSGVMPANAAPYLESQPVGQGLTAPPSPVRQAALDIMTFAGATLPVRDSADERVKNEFFRCEGSIIDSPSQVGGWPAMKDYASPADSDRDGMPDAWESARGLNAASAVDRNHDKNGDGYTELEEYLNEKAGDHRVVIGKGVGMLPAHRCGF